MGRRGVVEMTIKTVPVTTDDLHGSRKLLFPGLRFPRVHFEVP